MLAVSSVGGGLAQKRVHSSSWTSSLLENAISFTFDLAARTGMKIKEASIDGRAGKGFTAEVHLGHDKRCTAGKTKVPCFVKEWTGGFTVDLEERFYLKSTFF